MIDWIEKYFVYISITLLSIFTAYMVYVVGQPLFCGCTYLNFWNGFSLDAGNSQRLIDWYTFSHVIYGILSFYLLSKLFKIPFKVTLLVAVLISAAWEIIEHTDYIMLHFRVNTISSNYYGDSVLNSLSDVLAMAVGFSVTKYLRPFIVLIFIVIVELSSYYFIQDNLTINILSFIRL